MRECKGSQQKENHRPLVLRGQRLFCYYFVAMKMSLRGYGSKIPAAHSKINIPLNLHNTANLPGLSRSARCTLVRLFFVSSYKLRKQNAHYPS